MLHTGFETLKDCPIKESIFLNGLGYGHKNHSKSDKQNFVISQSRWAVLNAVAEEYIYIQTIIKIWKQALACFIKDYYIRNVMCLIQF